MKGVTFINVTTNEEKHSYTDMGLLLSERPEISPPDPKTVYVDVPGADGHLDLTEALTGDVTYENRQLTFKFVVMPPRSRWSKIYSDLLDFFHGRQMKIIIDEDPIYYYLGRVSVNEWASDKGTSKITVDVTVDPYKYERLSSLEPWKWDDFDFETGIIRDYNNIEVNGETELNVIGRRMKVNPRFHVYNSNGQGLTVTYDGQLYSIPEGTSQVVGLVLKEGDNILRFAGYGTVSIEYRGGRL